MASKATTEIVQDGIEDLLLQHLGDIAKVDVLPTDFNLEAIVEHTAERTDKYPHLFVFTPLTDQEFASSSNRMAKDLITVNVYVGVRNKKQRELHVQRVEAEQLCLYVRAALQGERVQGDYTNNAIIEGFSMDQEFNAEGFALYNTEFIVPIKIDLDDVQLP